MKAEKPIGVFDSGLGGLTVARRLAELMPGENIVYFGDTARVPYGTKTDAAILRCARSDCAFLMTRDIKAVVIACHTASSVAGDELARECPLPVFEVTLTSARAAVDAVKEINGRRIGVIGTPATIRSHCHRRFIEKLMPECRVGEAACPLFVPLVENGLTDPREPVVREAAKQQLAGFISDPPDALILGCTHFPLLAGVIGELLPHTLLIDPGLAVARQVKAALEKENGLNREGGRLDCFVSDEPRDFEKFAAAALGGKRIDSCSGINIEDY